MNRRILLFALAGAAGVGCSHPSAPAPPPPLVKVATAQARDVDVTGEWVASLDGYVNANIQPQVTGYVIAQEYAEGSTVKKDQVLFRIDPRPFQAAVDQARGQLAQAQGQLAQAQAQVQVQQAALGNATLNVQRDVPEAAANAIPQSQLQNDQQSKAGAEAGVAAAQATVKAQESAIQAATAQVEAAELNLGFTQVRSLIDGVAGVAQIQIGNLVTPQTVLTVVSQLNPIKAYFPINSQDYLRSISRTPGTVDLLSTDNPVALTLILNDGSTYPERGHVLFADRQVDSATGTLRLAAAFPNPGNRLRPGEYGRVRATTQHLHDVVVVPQAAVTQLQSAYQVAVVGPDGKVTIRTVQVGSTSGQDWAITSGLAAGEIVIVEGAMKVRGGMAVRTQTAGAAGGR